MDIGGVVQRFRWIQSGSFLMGSPESEVGHRIDEVLHHVTLTQGFWMADTACSQALWQVVAREPAVRFPLVMIFRLNKPITTVTMYMLVVAIVTDQFHFQLHLLRVVEVGKCPQ